MKRSNELSNTQPAPQPKQAATKTIEIVLEMPSFITDTTARKMAVKHFVNYAEKNYSKAAEQLEPFLNGATCSVNESGHLKIVREVPANFPPRRLSVLCHKAEEVWSSSLPSLLESNGMIKCEIK